MTAALAMVCALAGALPAQTISAQSVPGVGIATATARGTTSTGPTGPQTTPAIQQPTAPMGFSQPGANFTAPTAPFIGTSTPPFHQTPQTAPAVTAPSITAPGSTTPATTAPATTSPQTRATGGKSSRNDCRRPIRAHEAPEKGGSVT